ncbi:GNAT family N-acetyltransferase [Serinibacter salmoneus]|uniref:Acyl-CoA synthetase (NDP forming) n=1 Tax=Serinibacter salmoneus TaxID=556530 RepID=A0A2A9D0Q5_9MICO|nr:GNAT family N-acetyltransferase [Serinibacter salmoneus]PFG19532.1 acyl-CoA synthetase (NDP forming) [Serinibacter salmoneus]
MASDDVAYPTHWEADVLLRDGATMRIRPIRPDDAGALQDFHVAQSEESTYFRFFAPLRRLPERDLQRLVRVDHHDRVALVVVEDERIMAVGRYDVVEPGRAEVAFNVSDALQGRGVGSVLLEHLAAAARERGVDTFVADVLPGNAQMIRVFSDAGYEVVQHYEDGVISLEFAIDPTERSLDVLASREQRTDAASMRALLDPQGVLVLAGSREACLAQAVARHLAGRRDVACVGAALREVAEESGHRRLAAIEDAGADAGETTYHLAVLAAAPDEVIDWMPHLAAVGVRGVVVLSGGFDDTYPDAVGQADLLAAARAAGLRLVGPRSFGLLTAGPERANVTLTDSPPPLGGTALFCQSGAVALRLLALATQRQAGVRTFVSAGHRADVSGNDMLQYLDSSHGVRAVGMYLESLGNPRKFARVVRRVSAEVPVVAVVGAAQGEVMGERPTRRVVEQTMLTAGVLVAPTMRAMLDATTLLASQPLPPGDRIRIVSNSTSLAQIAAAQFTGLNRPTQVHAVPALDDAGLAHEIQASQERTDWDTLLVLYAPPLGQRAPRVTDALAATGARLHAAGRPVLGVVHQLVGLTPQLTHEGVCVPSYASIEDAVSAAEMAHTYARWRRRDHGVLVDPEGVDHAAIRGLVAEELHDLAAGEERELSAKRTRALLRHAGITVLRTRRVRSTPAALAAARDLGWPVAVKSTDPALRHRSDLGGVRLDIAGPVDLVDAVRQIRARQAGGEVEIQAMAPAGVACTVRSWDDPLFGPLLAFGLAGDATELLGDVSYALAPLRTGDVTRMIEGVRAAPRLLASLRGEQPDLAALRDVLARVSEVMETVPQLRHLDLEPVLVSAQGAVALHARVVVGATIRPDGARRALLAAPAVPAQ